MRVGSSHVILNRIGFRNNLTALKKKVFLSKKEKILSNFRRNNLMNHSQPLADNELVTETPGKRAGRVEETDINGLTPAVCRPYKIEKMQ